MTPRHGVLAIALLARLGALGLLAAVMQGREFADDFTYYQSMMTRPLMLITGESAAELRGARIYAPLVPLQLLLPGWPLIKLFGPFTGHRIAMICYDLTALSVTLSVVFRAAGSPSTPRDWAVALALGTVPVSVAAAALWGQEDTIAAFWASIVLLAWSRGHIVLAAIFAAAGLFTVKLFAVVLLLGLWLATPGYRSRVALAGAVSIGFFFLFLVIRWRMSGLFYPRYEYNEIGNSASPWAAWHLLVSELTFEGIKPVVMVVTALAMAAWSLLVIRGRLSVPAAIVGTHAAFFSVFIGIQPEHHQWFAPFLIYLAWVSFRQGLRLLPVTCWLYGTLAYAYKIAYGLRAGEINASPGKQVFRTWFAEHVGGDVFWIQISLLFAVLGCGLLLCGLCLKYGDGYDAAMDARRAS